MHPDKRIGNSNGIFARPRRPHPPQHPTPRRPHRAPSAPRPPASAARSTAARACGGCWTGAAACDRVETLGCSGGTAAGQATWQGWRGHPLDDRRSFVVASHLPVPFDPQGLVALNFLSARMHNALSATLRRPLDVLLHSLRSLPDLTHPV